MFRTLRSSLTRLWQTCAPFARPDLRNKTQYMYRGVLSAEALSKNSFSTTPNNDDNTDRVSMPNFNVPEVVTKGKSSWEVLRGCLVFQMFTFNSLVDNSLQLYGFSKRVLGSSITEKLLRATVFSQFAGGVNERETERVVRKLAERNISSIWFCSIDLGEMEIPTTVNEVEEQEDSFQKVNERYLKSIEMSAACNCDKPSRFAAVKLTAIVNPALLMKLNEMVETSRSTFLSLSSTTPSKLTFDRVITGDTMTKLLENGVAKEWKGQRSVDIVDWNEFFCLSKNIEHFSQLNHFNLQSGEKVPRCSLTELEQQQLQGFINRLKSIGECASGVGVRVLIDAEQTYFQKAIDHLVLHYMMKQFNQTQPVIYNTAQAYLTRAWDSLVTLVNTAERLGIQCGIKLVRGCYIEQENHLAKEHGVVSPIQPSKRATDNSYNYALDYLLEQVQSGKLHLVVASHNKSSIQQAINQMNKLKLSRFDGSVVFGQQLGMGDQLSYPLAQAGYIVNKVVSYGSMDDIMPFLHRRAQENRGMFVGAKEEKQLYMKELKRRITVN